MHDMKTDKPTSIRWWPLITIWALAAGGIVAVYVNSAAHRQGFVMAAIAMVLGAVGLSLAWLVAFSRVAVRARQYIVATTLVLGVGAGGLLKIEGVSGDLVPILKWRWSGDAPRARTPAAEQVAVADDHPEITDYPQFLGPNRDAKISGLSLVRDWDTHPPEQLWRQPIGAAWSAFAVMGRRAITQEQRGDDELVVCYDLLTGKIIWEHHDPARYETGLGGEGPRATPTIDGDRVFTLGATGILNCLELESGKVLWSRQIREENGAILPDWGFSGSPLIHENLVVVSAGGPSNRSLVAYDNTKGDFVWGGGSDEAHWSSPVRYEIAGQKQILIFNAGGVAAHDVREGAVQWEFPWKKGHPHVSLPVLLPGDRVFLSSGYGTGCALLQITRDADDGTFAAEEIWRSLRLKAKFNNVVFHEGYIYGLDDGTLVCLDVRDGSAKWKEGRYGHGQMILVDDLLLLTAENGEVVLLEPVPEEPRVLTRFQALTGKSWNPPAQAGPYLVVRNHLEAACYRLPVGGPR